MKISCLLRHIQYPNTRNKQKLSSLTIYPRMERIGDQYRNWHFQKRAPLLSPMLTLFKKQQDNNSVSTEQDHDNELHSEDVKTPTKQDPHVGYPGVMPDRPKLFGEPVMIVRNVSKAYTIFGRTETIKALNDVSLCPGGEFYPIRRGEFVMIVGSSGGGKTTLLNLLGTIDRPTDGSIEILGNVVDESSTDDFLSQLRLEKIGFVFQTFNLLATMSAFENVELPMTILGKLTRKERRARAIELLTLVGLRDRLEHLPSEMSGGEQQRVAVARSLANDPDILLLDEPTGDLDTRNTIALMDLLMSINVKRRTTCVMVTHNNDLECYADRILSVHDGTFYKQELNEVQVPLVFSSYIAYEHSQEKGADVL